MARSGTRGARASKHAGIVLATLGLLSAAAVACGTILDLDDERPVAETPDGAASGQTRDGGDEGGDGAIGELLPGTDGALDDGAPIAMDATADQYNPPGCPGAPACERVVFVTSSAIPSSSVRVANTYCTTLAASANAHPRIKGRTFVAWASTSLSGSPATRFVQATMPYIRPDGTVVAQSWADLTDGTLAKSIFHDETGASVPAATKIWTGTLANGVAAAPDCDDWQAGAGVDGRVGTVGATDFKWSSWDQSLLGCEMLTARLYCFEL